MKSGCSATVIWYMSEAPQDECAFAPRCPHARDVCLTGVPGLVETGGGLSRCARTHELRGKLQAAAGA